MSIKTEFWNLVRFVGPWVALQLAVYVVPMFSFKEKNTQIALAQVAGAVAVTGIAGGVGYFKGKRAGKIAAEEES